MASRSEDGSARIWCGFRPDAPVLEFSHTRGTRKGSTKLGGAAALNMPFGGAVRQAAWAYGKKLQPQKGAFRDLFDALQLGNGCGVAPPPPQPVWRPAPHPESRELWGFSQPLHPRQLFTKCN